MAKYNNGDLFMGGTVYFKPLIVHHAQTDTFIYTSHSELHPGIFQYGKEG